MALNPFKMPYDPAIPLLGIHTEETRIERDTCTPMFIAALFLIARTWRQPRCPSTDEWIRKLWYTQWSITQPLKRIHLSQFFASGGQRTGVSASVSVLPVNIQE